MQGLKYNNQYYANLNYQLLFIRECALYPCLIIETNTKQYNSLYCLYCIYCIYYNSHHAIRLPLHTVHISISQIAIRYLCDFIGNTTIM